MKLQPIEDFRQQHVRGPHLRYFVLTLTITFLVALILATITYIYFRLAYPAD
ncbi:hypothetical protein [Chryseolinea lacunae]|uniref:Uncharacterized protein n=1 Tax=Chryseolinea lacunae TaxID=2801331 RepID=A0ABS1KNJ7_9BACT|nr:hypothetical protein [Chryseolinea lacunae]MBL0741029.1 hypothetical protein [Chryseolinea lacunae]